MTGNRADKLVRDMFIKKVKRTEARKGIFLAPPRRIGNITKGTLHDCNRKAFERSIRAYDSKLIVGWNPLKRDGLGVWEVWRLPEHKPVSEMSDFEHWVADLPYLSYGFIEKLKSMDSWANKHQVVDSEQAAEDYESALNKHEEELVKYAVKHNKRAFREMAGHVKQGINPFWFFSDKRQGDGQV